MKYGSGWVRGGFGLATTALLVLSACTEKAKTEEATPQANANASATVAPKNAEPTGAGTATAAAAGTTVTAAAGNATVGTPDKGVMVNDGGVKIVNDNGKQVTVDGGQLTLKNNSGQGSVTATDAGLVLKGKDGKTLTIPPVPGLK